MSTVVIVAAAALGAALVSLVVSRRRPDAPTSPEFAVPQQLDRADFESPDSDWLLILFSSKTCMSCIDAAEVLDPIDLPDVAVQELQVENHRSTHDRYAIDAVPTLVLADREGVVRWSFLGAPPPEAVHQTLVDIGVIERDDGTPVGL